LVGKKSNKPLLLTETRCWPKSTCGRRLVKVCHNFCWISSFIADSWFSCWHGMYAEL